MRIGIRLITNSIVTDLPETVLVCNILGHNKGETEPTIDHLCFSFIKGIVLQFKVCYLAGRIRSQGSNHRRLVKYNRV